MKNWKTGSTIWRTVFDLAKKAKKLKELEDDIAKPETWEDKSRIAQASKEISRLKEEINNFNDLEREINDLKALAELAQSDENLFPDVEKKRKELENKIKKEEAKLFLSGKYDRNNAIIEIRSGAGGVDAQDWATMLLRMYSRYCASRSWNTKIIEQSFGEGGGPEGRIGTKSAIIEVKGDYAYGILKKETGIHRLVRQSPFSAKKLRHTSFALVDVLPEIPKKDQKDIKISSEDIKIDTYKSSGPGGQNVNKRESAVRITHLPTGIIVSSQSERLQGLNREKAMEILFSKLYQLREMEKEKDLKNLKGEAVSASWGNQIRSYVLHPYKMVKDLRTNVEVSDAVGVLEGDLEEFITEEIKLNKND